MGLNDIPLANN